VFATLTITALFGFAALSIDVGLVYKNQRDMQVAADAASLAAVARLADSTPSKDAVIKEAVDIAAANGVTLGEITNSALGKVQIGTWDADKNLFTPDTAPSQWNAVRVPALRTVRLLFGNVIGLGSMKPPVHSVSMLTGVSSVTGHGVTGQVVPFGLQQSMVTGVRYGSIIDLHDQGPGNTGALDFHGEIKNPHAWYAAFVSGYGGTVSIKDTDNAARPGIPSWVSRAFDQRIQDGNTTVTMPVVAESLQGSHGVTIVGFVSVQLISAPTGGVGNFSGQVRFLGDLVNGEGGGPSGSPFAQTRALVQ
jgi:hypothetical protein